ncbi:MAG: type 4a pilus biogenesis protein PilO [Candidatus Marinimicrobia bacterium]|nr:type 4a pilus biogenesis protein PilO [Candidatus Neomarinimicrobiota bacterium]
MNQQRIGLINIGILFVAVLGWLFFLYLPVHQEIQTMNQELISMEQHIVQVGSIERNRAQIEERVKNLEKDLIQLFESVNSDKGIENTIDMIDQLAEHYNLELEYVNPSPIDQFSVPGTEQRKYFEKSLHSYPIDVFLNGKFIPTGKFLEELSAHTELVHIQSIHLLTDTQLPDKLHIEIKLLAYTAKE